MIISTCLIPPYSPDLNPIENTWVVVKSRFRKNACNPTSEDELWGTMTQAWDSTPMETVNRQIMGMPRGPQRVKEAKGF